MHFFKCFLTGLASACTLGSVYTNDGMGPTPIQNEMSKSSPTSAPCQRPYGRDIIPSEDPTSNPPTPGGTKPTSGGTKPPTSGSAMPPTSGDTTPTSGDAMPPTSGDTTPTSGSAMPPTSGSAMPPTSGDTTPTSGGLLNPISQHILPTPGDTQNTHPTTPITVPRQPAGAYQIPPEVHQLLSIFVGVELPIPQEYVTALTIDADLLPVTAVINLQVHFAAFLQVLIGTKIIPGAPLSDDQITACKQKSDQLQSAILSKFVTLDIDINLGITLYLHAALFLNVFNVIFVDVNDALDQLAITFGVDSYDLGVTISLFLLIWLSVNVSAAGGLSVLL